MSPDSLIRGLHWLETEDQRAMCHHYPKGRDGLVFATYQAAWLTCRLPG